MRIRVGVAVAVFAIEDGDFKVGLRKETQATPVLSLPMAFVADEDQLDDVATRLSRTVVTNKVTALQQIGAYLLDGEESKERTLVVGYMGICQGSPVAGSGMDAALGSLDRLVRGMPKAKGVKFVEPHDHILWRALSWLNRALEESLVAAEFCGSTFTISELRKVYEAVWQTKLDPSNFHRKVTNPKLGLVRKVRQPSGKGPSSIAAVYERGTGELLHPPLRRPPPKGKKRRHRSVWTVPLPAWSQDPAADEHPWSE